MASDNDKGSKGDAPMTIARTGPLVTGVSRPAFAQSRLQLAAIVLDSSGSMAIGAKIDDANAAAVALNTELADPKNRGGFHAALIAYGDHAVVQMPAKRAVDVRPDELAVQVGTVGTGTNLTAGLELALDLIERSLKDGRQWARPVVVLMTDGHHNASGSSPESVAGKIKAKGDLVAVAFGADADMALLRKLATSSKLAVRCSNGAELRKFFATVGATMSVARQTGQSAAALLGASGVIRGS